MARKAPTRRFSQLIDTATETFIAHGYQRTQMEEIANSLGVAKGTLYGYVESKAALTTIIHDLFGRLSRNRRGIKLLGPATCLPSLVAALSPRESVDQRPSSPSAWHLWSVSRANLAARSPRDQQRHT